MPHSTLRKYLFYIIFYAIITQTKQGEPMTILLEKAFKKASTLPEVEQDIFARIFMEEIESEKKWGELFSKSEDLLGDMADVALDDYANAKTNLLTQEQL